LCLALLSLASEDKTRGKKRCLSYLWSMTNQAIIRNCCLEFLYAVRNIKIVKCKATLQAHYSPVLYFHSQVLFALNIVQLDEVLTNLRGMDLTHVPMEKYILLIYIL